MNRKINFKPKKSRQRIFTLAVIFIITQVFGSFIPYVGGMYVAKASGLSEFKKDYNYDDGQPEVWDFIEGSGNITKASVKLTAQMNDVLNAVI